MVHQSENPDLPEKFHPDHGKEKSDNKSFKKKDGLDGMDGLESNPPNLSIPS